MSMNENFKDVKSPRTIGELRGLGNVVKEKYVKPKLVNLNSISITDEFEDECCDDPVCYEEVKSKDSPNYSKKKFEINAKQWSDMDGKIIPVNNTFSELEPGYYTIDFSNNCGMFFVKQDISLNKLYRLPNEATNLIMDDISKFWTLEDTYKKYNRIFKRNYLLYSAPGTGKTSLINLMCKDLIEKYNGIVLALNSADEIRMYPAAIQRIRKIEPNRKIITIIEDIDNFLGDPYGNSSSSLDTHILNTLDGNLTAGGVVNIATTNYIEKLASRYKNRPSRFDRVVEFPLPNEESRRMFIEKTVLPEDLDKIDLDKWVKKTNGYTIDHLNELILLYFVFNNSEAESFDTIDRMVRENNRLKNKSSEMKSQIGF